MRHLLLLGSSLLLAGTVQAQATFSIGPRLGGNIASARFLEEEYQVSYKSHPGFEAGLLGNLQVGHFALQPSVLFSQRGYRRTSSVRYIDPPIPPDPGTVEETKRLNYLTVPLNLAFTLRRDGQGLQVFGGPYVGLLLGGKHTYHLHVNSPNPGGTPYDREDTYKVKAGSVVSPPIAGDESYSQRYDVGLQAGLGYRFNGLLLQAGYSLGLRNQGVQYDVNSFVYNAPANYNRAWQLSLSYLVGSKS
jgi:hypothetical protein